MKVFFGKFSKSGKDSEFFNDQVNHKRYYAKKDSGWFGEIQEKDYCFIVAGSNIYLWKAKEFVQNGDEEYLQFEQISSLSSVLPIDSDKLKRFKYFKLTPSLIVLMTRMARNRAFFQIVINNELTSAILEDINTYTVENNFRKIYIVDPTNALENDNIFLIKSDPETYSIYHSNFIDEVILNNFIDNTNHKGQSGKKRSNKDSTIERIKHTQINQELKNVSLLAFYDLLFNEYKQEEIIEEDKNEINNESVEKSETLQRNSKSIKHPLNQILYGPPGTGKTYNAINKALEIIYSCKSEELQNKIKNDSYLSEEIKNESDERRKLKKVFDYYKDEAKQIVFTTFHQSFGYEEFVEGIKAEAEDSLISYDIKAGIFKKLCELAKQKSHIKFELQGINFQNYIKVNQKFQTLTGIEFEITSVNEKIKVKNSQNKVHALSRKSILDYLEKQDFTNTRGHFSYQPVIAKYIFDQLEKKSLEDNTNKNYILIIDEINRGNISKIFGELITLIEPSKRIGEDEEIRVTLPYSGMGTDRKGFGVPSNLYIIGTMNTADRSIAQIDTALRRRFVFEEMMPDLTLLAKKDFKLEEEESLSYEENQNDLLIVNDKNSAIETINVRLMVKVINERIEYYYDREHMIGHSYFLPLIDIPTKEKLDEIFKINILPLLAEYFYGDWGDIQKILNNNFVDKKKKSSYIKDDSNQKNLYDINKEFTVAQYRKIYDNNEA